MENNKEVKQEVKVSEVKTTPEAKVEIKQAPANKPGDKNTGNKPSYNANNRSHGNRPNDKKGGKPGGRKGGFVRKPSEYQEKVISIRRVVRVSKGGRRFRFSALVVIGNKKGQVGYGIGKSNEVPDAIKKAIKDAKKNLIKVHIIPGADTVPCEITAKYSASRVMVKPAKEGTGIIASSSVRSVLELAGIRNVYTKSLGSNTPKNVIGATLKSLETMTTKEEVMRLRDLEEL